MNIRVDLNTPIKDGTEVVFRSPVDCSQVTGLKVYYLGGSQEFVFADAHGNNVGDIDHLFAENVAVKVILDVTHGMAFVQNADTNAYLEGRFGDIESALDAILAIQNELTGETPVVTITFTIDGTVYTANDGMTWGEWIDSKYNTDGFIAGDIHVHKDGLDVCTEEGSTVCLDEIITANAEYVFI